MTSVEEAAAELAERLEQMHPGWRKVLAEMDHSEDSPLVRPFREACSRLAAAVGDIRLSLNEALTDVEATARDMPPLVRKAHIRMTYSPLVTMPEPVRAYWDAIPGLLAAVDNEENADDR